MAKKTAGQLGSTFLGTALAEIRPSKGFDGNIYAGIAEEGFIGGDVEEWMDSGAYLLNGLLSSTIYGGAAIGKVLGLSGEEATGKTFFVIELIRSFLKSHPNAGIVYFESEGAIGRKMLKSRGIDTKRVLAVPVSTVQDFKTQALRIVDKYLKLKTEQQRDMPMMFVLDSLGMLSTSKEQADTQEGNGTKDMTRAGELKGAFRVLTLKLGLCRIPMLVTAHTYQGIGMFAEKRIVGGGGGLKYAASTIVDLSKKQDKESGETVGVIIHCKNKKNRAAQENKTIDVRLSYTQGLSRYYGLVEFASEHGGVFEKLKGGEYEFPTAWTKEKTLEGVIEWLKTYVNGKPDASEPKSIVSPLSATAVDTVVLSIGKKDDKQVVAYWNPKTHVACHVQPCKPDDLCVQGEKVFTKQVLDVIDAVVHKVFSYGSYLYHADLPEHTPSEGSAKDASDSTSKRRAKRAAPVKPAKKPRAGKKKT